MKEVHGVAQIRLQPKAKLGECRDRLINIHRLPTRLSNENVLPHIALEPSRERINIDNCAGENLTDGPYRRKPAQYSRLFQSCYRRYLPRRVS